MVCSGALLHELSNEGARQQFAGFVEEMILPQMCACAQVRWYLLNVGVR